MAHKFHTHHHYLLFEFDNIGYVLRYLKCPNGDKKAIRKKNKMYYLVASKEEQGYSNQEIVRELGFLSSYPIKTHKARIKGHINDSYCLGFTSASENNVLYYLSATCEIKDFKKLTRFDASRHIIFLSSLIDQDGFEESAELYLN